MIWFGRMSGEVTVVVFLLVVRPQETKDERKNDLENNCTWMTGKQLFLFLCCTPEVAE